MDAREQQAFDLGWDHAAFAMPVPETANRMFCDGYRAWGIGSRRKPRKPDRYVRKWLQIRHGALLRNKPFSTDVTPDYLRRITPKSGKCPVLDEVFTYARDRDTDWSVDRANNDRGYVCGNIIIIARLANQAKSDRGLDELRTLAAFDRPVDGLTPEQWHRFAELIEPAFGDGDASASPVPILFGQPVALGMPVSPIAGFQIALTRALVEGWQTEQRDLMTTYVQVIEQHCCHDKGQRRAFRDLVREILRRSTHVGDYTVIWSTTRVQRRLFSFVSALGGHGLHRLSELQDMTIGPRNTRLV